MGRMLLVRVTVLVAIVILLLCPSTGHSAALPASITTHTTTSTDDSIPTGGTTLSVQAMLDDAASNNRSEAVFDATRLTFNGMLTITLPTTAAAWTTRNIPLRIVVRDGASGGAPASWLTTYIKVTGVLALGSNISILGGTYDYTVQFIHLPFGLTVQDDSTLAIEGGTYRAHYPGTFTSLVRCRDDRFTLSNRGTFSISHNTMQVSYATVTGSWALQTVDLNGGVLVLSVSSTVSISNNTVTATNINIGGSWYWYTIDSRDGFTMVDSNSTLSISHATTHVSDATTGGEFWWCTLMAVRAAITVSASSTLSIILNDISASNLDVSADLYVYELHAINTPVTVHTGSYLTISNITSVMTNVKVEGSWHWVTYYPADKPNANTTIHNGSSLTISNHSATASKVSVGSIWLWYTVYANVSPLSITASSIMSITDNVMLASDVRRVGSFMWFYVLHSLSRSFAVADSSTFMIAHIRMEMTDVSGAGDWTWAALYSAIAPSLAIRTLSTVSVSNVHMVVTNAVLKRELLAMLFYSKSTPMSITTGNVTISNNSMLASNVNAWRGFYWYALYNTDSVYDITTGSTLAIFTNSLTTTTGAGTARLVSMGGSGVRDLGTTNGSVCTRHSSCSDADSKGVYLCGNDMSGGSSIANTQQLTFDCTLPFTTPPPTTPPTTTASPWSPSNQYNNQGSSSSSGLGTSALVAVIVSVVVGFAILVVVTVLVSVFCCCKKRSTLPDAPQQSPEHRVVELTPTTTYQQQHLEYSSTPYTTATNNAQPVLGVPMEEMPVADNKGGREVPPPYGGGGCYL